MAIEITVPRQGWSMEEAIFSVWLKGHGEMVRAGDALFAVESDKATQEIESFDGGLLYLAPDAPKPGEKVRVGQVIGYLLAAGESAPSSGGRSQESGVRSLLLLLLLKSRFRFIRKRKRPSPLHARGGWRESWTSTGLPFPAPDVEGAFARLISATRQPLQPPAEPCRRARLRVRKAQHP